VLLDATAIATLNTKVLEVKGAYRDVLSPEVGDQDKVTRDLTERSEWMAERTDSGKYVEGDADSMKAARDIVAIAAPIDELRVMTQESQAYCLPLASGLFSPRGDADSPTWDAEFDRNHCSSLHPGELVRVLRRSQDNVWWHVHAGHSVGWVAKPGWTPALPIKVARKYRDADPRAWVVDDQAQLSGMKLRVGTSFPLLGEDDQQLRVQIPTSHGLEEASIPRADAVVTSRPAFTRKALFELAFAQLDAPYGWGGRAGGRDCSRYLYDGFSTFGIHLGRHSSVQAQLGSESISLEGLDEDAKREAIRQAAARGVVLLYMPGHIMLYLGRDGHRDFGLSSLSEFLVPCEGGPDSIYRLDRVTVTTLDVGRGSERTAFIERINRMSVFGPVR
jgi:cell wall-associated NlpC family hydrolase